MDRPQQQRTRSKSTFSFKSDKSHTSGHKGKEHLHESPEEKRRSHLTATTKANPNAAMNEAQPIAAALEKPTLQSLRSFQHTDTNGQVIAEPDLSNPTRSRWERPLDTIRSFEAAIDNEYRRRAQTMRPESSTEVMNGYTSRRSSYYGGHDQNRFSQVSGYYGTRQAAAARESWAESGYGPTGGPAGGPPRSRYNRMQSDQGYNRYANGHGVYPNQSYQQSQSRDTVNTGGSNGSHSDPYSTDPSSENSSIERATPVTKPDMGEQYGFSGFGGGPQFQGPILEEFGNGARLSNNGYSQQQYPTSANIPPPVPAKTSLLPPSNGRPIKLNDGQVQPGASVNARSGVLQRNNTEKRKSWFKRRFSKD
ncbi:uncharacterized protein BDR25DRAFT_63632 [Lindgomyces ingoldianus]|uniref:Uncharacterized protein n=1 Tax=Lindgomyces ingoldianus TaxID=673940 RepID=A0ACB6QN27_9PLEO|nr:uncharacterized protein BDR25DRAFT_63632 [Lindgomyces ingoldianus]KAF2467556.1 hypothetical protein BDR25DRAFT_63632 [Lindgomyces ingoldianus]